MEETHAAFAADDGQQEGPPQQQPSLQTLSLGSMQLPPPGSMQLLSPQQLLPLGKSLSELGPLQGLPSHQPLLDQGMPQQLSDPAAPQQPSPHPSEQQDRYAALSQDFADCLCQQCVRMWFTLHTLSVDVQS